MRLDGYRARQNLVEQSANCADSYIPHMLCNTAAMFSGVNPTYGVLYCILGHTAPGIVLVVCVHSCSLSHIIQHMLHFSADLFTC